ncbi:unnamed protein product, partial [Darwinula stevensoni]
MSRFVMDYERRRESERRIEEDTQESEIQTLLVEALEFHEMENAQNHHTDSYELVYDGTPVLRRGEAFFVTLRFKDRDYEAERDMVKFVFSFGNRASLPKGTKVVLTLTDRTEFTLEGEWDIRLHDHQGSAVTVQIQIPPTVTVGLWKLVIETGTFTETPNVITGIQEHKVKEDIYILFNPWSSGDSVYMEAPEDCEEYVLNDTGKIWVGTFKSQYGRPWVYGQFDDAVLPAVMTLLELAGLQPTDWANPILVVRAISRA